MRLRDRVIQFLTANSGKKAREIAEHLGVDRGEVNSVLYREKDRTFVQESGFRWRVQETPSTAATARRERAASTPDTPLSKLCRYYLACLAKDIDRDVSEWASSRYGDLQYAELAELPALPGAGDDLWSDDTVRRIVSRYRQDLRRLALYVGYPTRLARIVGRNRQEYWRVEPIFIFEYQLDRFESTPSLTDKRPDVNLKAIQRLTAAEGSDIFIQSLRLQEELGLDGQAVDPEDLEDVLLALQEVRPDWPWKENIVPNQLTPSPPLAGLRDDGIYNRAVLLTAERSPYTRGLEAELERLAGMPEEQWRGTALEAWIHGQFGESAAAVNDEPLIEILPLNTEQRQAVQRSLTRPLTVITGPPGTGKSQVVTSIVVNCAWRGAQVLFASKNNKAVDVVEARVNALGPRPLLLRLGAQEYQSRLAEYLSALLAATATPEDEAAFTRARRRYDSKLEERYQLQVMLDHLIQVRNSVDTKEQHVESLRESLGKEWFRHLAGVKLAPLGPTLRQVHGEVDRANRDKQGWLTRLFWPFVRSSRLKRAAAAVLQLESFGRQLGVHLPPDLIEDPELPRLQHCVSQVSKRSRAARLIQEYFHGLAELKGATSSESIAARSIELEHELGEVCQGLWRLWLRLQPSRLDQSERRLLGDFAALVQRINRANEAGQRVGRDIFRRFYEMFPRLTKLLPAWAVTNLSARGRLPLQAGFFDLLVIDEASQCDIASVLPLLYRCKRAVIIGDPKQLKHITQIVHQVEQELMTQYGVWDLGEAWSYATNSLFDRASSLSASGDVIALRDHHRSHADIIGFSNEYFYEERLRIATRYDRLRFLRTGGPAIRWVEVAGTVRRPPQGSAINREEARAVVGELARILVDQSYEGTVGVVTPFRAQANRIRDLVHQDDRIMACVGRSELLVDTVYKFQGDERDVILFSPVVSRDTPRTTLGFLGANQNTFNVAITRARAALIVVGDRGACSACGVEHLSRFADYVAERPGQQSSKHDCGVDLGPTYPTVTNPERVSDWEKVFYRQLYRRGLRPIPQYNVEQYQLDLALRSASRKLDIEIDGEAYHRAWDGELMRRDQIRNRRLIELGWDVMRFWVYQIRDDAGTCVDSVLAWVTKAQASSDQDSDDPARPG